VRIVSFRMEYPRFVNASWIARACTFGSALSLQILLLHRLVDSRAILFGPTLAGPSSGKWLRLLL
jgi:hypothetical protein